MAAEEGTKSLSRVFRAQSKVPRTAQVQRGHAGASWASRDPAVILQEAERRAIEVLNDARTEAATLAEVAAAESVRIRDEAREAGYAEGFRNGRQSGLDQTKDLLREAEAALDSSRGAFTQMTKEAEPKLLALALEIARRVISDALQANPEVLMNMVREGMDALRDEREFSLHVDPALVSLIEDARDDLGRAYGARSIEVVQDSSVKGGVIVRTPHGFVDVTLESQIRNISLALAEARKRSLGDVH